MGSGAAVSSSTHETRAPAEHVVRQHEAMDGRLETVPPWQLQEEVKRAVASPSGKGAVQHKLALPLVQDAVQVH